ncbi:Multiple Epidermal Growth Factor-Like Domains Protein 6 [Manis pentadactyla]|nr:Multiple Epidermal Growth Factor-Like Domains Protein 6 [Manis pentadactyla]
MFMKYVRECYEQERIEILATIAIAGFLAICPFRHWYYMMLQMESVAIYIPISYLVEVHIAYRCNTVHLSGSSKRTIMDWKLIEFVFKIYKLKPAPTEGPCQSCQWSARKADCDPLSSALLFSTEEAACGHEASGCGQKTSPGCDVSLHCTPATGLIKVTTVSMPYAWDYCRKKLEAER